MAGERLREKSECLPGPWETAVLAQGGHVILVIIIIISHSGWCQSSLLLITMSITGNHATYTEGYFKATV